MRIVMTLVALVLAGGLLAACGGGAGASTGGPTWVPQPSFTPEPGPNQGIVGGPQAPGPGGSSSSNSSSPSAGSSSTADPAVVATGLNAPTGIAVLPDGSALVGERTTGRILHVQATAGQPVAVVRTLTGLDTTGGGGLLDLALSPSYSQDGLVYAYLTTATGNEVVDFTLTGAVSTVLAAIPAGVTGGNVGRIAFDALGNLFIATGNAGQPALAQTPTSLAGKILYINDIGKPVGASAVYAQGLRAVGGLCVDSSSGTVIESEPAGSGQPDEINVVTASADFGWPADHSGVDGPVAQVPASESGTGGCAVSNSVLYLTSLDHTELLAANLTVSGNGVTVGSFSASLTGKYGRLLTVVAAPDGSLWLTTSNKDGHGNPTPDDERVLHIPPPGGGGSSKA
jgi:glucose/arabinose dehydrogenase